MLRLALKRKGLSYRCFSGDYPSFHSSLLWSTSRSQLLPIPLRTWREARAATSLPHTSHFKVNNTDVKRAFNSDNDTIYALSSGQGRAGVAVIRVSGPASLEIYDRLCRGKKPPPARYAAVRTLYDYEPESGDWTVLDSGALVLHFPGPKSVTGEDVLELHTHGGPATVKAVLSALPRCSSGWPGSSGSLIRYAEPGEFTRRAFFNGRLDLAQVESLSDTLDAETEQQRRAAVRGNSGALGRAYDSWSRELLMARGEIEALIDFAEDQHFDESLDDLLSNVIEGVFGILEAIEAHEAAGQRHELLRNGIRIALLGPPNAGKSSLMNLIVGREASIVSTEAGTTRDIVEASLDIRGYLCTFADTAGIRSDEQGMTSNGDEGGDEGITSSPIGAVEQEGIRRARSKALDSDIVVVLASIEPSTSSSSNNCKENTGSGSYYKIRYDEETMRLAAKAERAIIVINKRDTAPTSELKPLIDGFRASVLAKYFLPGPGSAGGSPHSGGTTLTGPTAEPPLAIISCKEAAATLGAATTAAASGGADTSTIRMRRSSNSRSTAIHSTSSSTTNTDSISSAWAAAVTTAPSAGDAPTTTTTPVGLSDTGPDPGDPGDNPAGDDPGGIRALVDNTLVAAFESLTSFPPDMQDLFGVTVRQRQLLARCKGHLEDFMAEATRGGGDGGEGAVIVRRGGENDDDPNRVGGPDIVLAAEHLRYARNCLAAITGRGESFGDVEEVLGVIFEKFCVGK